MKNKDYTIIVLMMLSFLFGSVVTAPNEPKHLPTNVAKIRQGTASYYDYSIGDWSSVGHHVCAIRDFIRYSFVEVVNLDNGLSTKVCVTDFGPDESVFPDRIVDLSSTAFSDIADLKDGVARVSVIQLNEFCK